MRPDSSAVSLGSRDGEGGEALPEELEPLAELALLLLEEDGFMSVVVLVTRTAWQVLAGSSTARCVPCQTI